MQAFRQKGKNMRNRIMTWILILTVAGLTSCSNPKPGTRWSEEKARAWGAKQPWLVGANFNPSDASNQLDMWQKETWNPELINKELGWAAAIGMNTMRVYLHQYPYRDDKEGFLKRMDQFLDIAARHKIKPMFVLFDAVWNPNPVAGPQPDPKPHLHNANWMQCPEKDLLWNPERHIELKPYVQGVIERFKDDERVLLWDLYNEPQNTNGGSYKDHGKEKYSLMLLKAAFAWAREVNPSQPISSAPWLGDWSDPENLSEFDAFMFDNSDIITFHNYDHINEMIKRVGWIKRYNRPIICTEYMARGNNSRFETHIPFMARANIGAINWGLVDGRSQTKYPWDSWRREYTAEPELWFHEVFRRDGTPYKQAEVDVIKTFAEARNGEKGWEMAVRGKKTALFTLKNDNGVEVTITNYGGKIVTLKVPDKNGAFADIVLGYDSIQDTVAGNLYFGAMIGRYGNRIAKGRFAIDGTEYSLAVNNGENALHGGLVGHNDVVWDAAQEGNRLTLKHLDPDMFEGYPGNLDITVVYELTDDNALKITYDATTDKPTVVNLTHHSFFNLRGAGEGTILDHALMIAADKYTPVDAGLIPTGELAGVKGTPFDFTAPTAIGKNINADDPQIKNGGGFDHNFALRGGKGTMKMAARVVEPESGRTMEVHTTEPGLQFYAGNFLDGTDVGKGGKAYGYRTAFCLETQHYPDSPNKKHFPSTVLRPGEKYHTETIYKFGTVK